MSQTINPFTEEWRDCLREHYKYVVRHDTRITLESLRQVLLSGERPLFTEDELRAFYMEATLRADELPEDFMPELLAEVLEQEPDAAPQAPAVPENPAHPLECQCPACISINLIPHDEEGQPLTEEALEELHEELSQRRAHEDDDAPQQLSLF